MQRKKPIIQEKINQVTKHVEVPRVQFPNKVDEMPVGVQRQIPMVQVVQKTMEIPQLQCVDEAIDGTVVQVPRVQVVEKTVEGPQLQIVEQIVETPETQTIQSTQTSERLGGAPVRAAEARPTGVVNPGDLDAKIKFLAAEALYGVHGNRLANELGRRDCVTGEMWKKKPPFRLALNRAASDDSLGSTSITLDVESGSPRVWYSTCRRYGGARLENAHCQASLKSAKDPDRGPYTAFASDKSWNGASGKTGSEKKFYHNFSSGADFAAQTPVTTMTVASTVLTADTVRGDRYVDKPVVVQRQVPMIPNMQKTVEVPQIQYVDKIVDAPVAVTQPSVPAEAERESCSKKRKSTSDEMVDEASDHDAFGLVQGRECTRVADESEVQGPEDELVPVAPNMGAGGSHSQATLNQEWAEELRVIRRMVEFLVRRERKLDV